MKLKELVKMYYPNRGFRVWKRINSNTDWCYKVALDCRSEEKDLGEFADREVERIDVVNDKLEIMVEQIGENEYWSDEEIAKELRK